MNTNGTDPLEHLSSVFRESHEITQSWRLTADPYGINKAMARMIANGYNPGARIRSKLNLPQVSSVVVIDGEIPDGTQALSALYCIDCGKPFIPNHPRRRKCFVCSPFRKRL